MLWLAYPRRRDIEVLARLGRPASALSARAGKSSKARIGAKDTFHRNVSHLFKLTGVNSAKATSRKWGNLLKTAHEFQHAAVASCSALSSLMRLIGADVAQRLCLALV